MTTTSDVSGGDRGEPADVTGSAPGDGRASTPTPAATAGTTATGAPAAAAAATAEGSRREGGSPPAQAATGRSGLWSPRAVLLLVSGVVAVALAAVIALLPVPYVVFSPGPVRDTLGQTDDGVDLILIEGAETYDTSGELALTTIRVFGGPLGDVSLLEAARAWFDPQRSVRPVESVYPADETREEAREVSEAQMAAAQQTAAVAALGALGQPVSARLVVAGFAGNPGVEEVVEEGDVVVGVAGMDVTSSGELIELLQAYEPGDAVTIELDRSGEPVPADVVLAESETGTVILGVFLSPDYDLPYEVAYDVGGIGGPSAGLMFALGIYDKLTPGALTGGTTIAGTGTMSDDGTVGPIDGIRQKLYGARGEGADWFLAPADNCGDVAGRVPDGLRVVAVSTIDEAIDAVEAIGTGEGTDQLPECTAG